MREMALGPGERWPLGSFLLDPVPGTVLRPMFSVVSEPQQQQHTRARPWQEAQQTSPSKGSATDWSPEEWQRGAGWVTSGSRCHRRITKSRTRPETSETSKKHGLLGMHQSHLTHRIHATKTVTHESTEYHWGAKFSLKLYLSNIH